MHNKQCISKKYVSSCKFLTAYSVSLNEYVIAMQLGHCPVDHYQCSDKRCVRISKVCDGHKDCLDNSDEVEGCNGKKIK